MSIYIVKFDGFLGGYGCQYYLLGIYDNSDEAIAAKEAFDREYEKYGLEADVQEVVLNQKYDIKVDQNWAVSTSICLGGYVE